MSELSASAGAGAQVCGARTQACSVHTRVNASSPPFIRTGPPILLSASHHPGIHWVLLDISRDAFPLPAVSDAMVVRLPLPKRLAGSPKHSVCLASGKALERLQQQARSHQRQQQHVDMVRHDRKRSNMVLPQIGPFEQRSDYQLRDRLLPQEHGAGGGTVETSIDPNKCLPARKFVSRRISAMGKTPMQMPGNEEPLALRIDMGQPAGWMHRSNSAPPPIKLSYIALKRGTHACSVHTRANAKCLPAASREQERAKARSHECERCTHECVRHNSQGNTQANGQPGKCAWRRGLI